MTTTVDNNRAKEDWRIERDGFEILPSILDHVDCDRFARTLTEFHERQDMFKERTSGGLRNLLRDIPEVSQLALSQTIGSILREKLGEKFFPIRALFFDKTPGSNWFVSWHQDLTIALSKKIETEGYVAWSVKDGVAHVQPPANILKQMATLRIHLDDCGAENGALKVIPRSHLNGKIQSDQLREIEFDKNAITCETLKGDALLFRPLLLHSSSRARHPVHRRVLHIEYACRDLPNGLKWYRWT